MQEEVDLQEFVSGFIAESEQLVASATARLLEIDEGNSRGELRPKAVRELFRALHTLKGLAGMMGVRPIIELAHALESVVRAADQVGGRFAPRAVELGLIAVRAIGESVRQVADKQQVSPAPEQILGELARVDASSTTTGATAQFATAWDRKLTPSEREQLASALAAHRSVYTLPFAPSDDNAARGITISTVRERIGAVGEIVKVAPRSVATSADAPAGLVFELLVASDQPPARLAEIAATTVDKIAPVVAEAALQVTPLPAIAYDEDLSPIQRSFLRVELSRLDELQGQLSALIVSRFRLENELAALAAAGHPVRRMKEVVEQLSRELRDLRRGILRARLVRVAEVLEPLGLLVRSATRPGVKDVRLELDLADAELDKAVADRLLPAIVHLVRNAIDHAIEPVAERERVGKPAAGQIRIVSRERAGNELELAIIDDGRGIDRDAIARRAGRAIDSDEALLDALAAPGFSTRAEVSETSGRGLGMDIVRRIATALGGRLSVSTVLGQGTTFTVRVPLTIAILDVFSFECGRQSFVAPVAMIEEIVDLEDVVTTRGPTAQRDSVAVRLCEHRGKPLPVIALESLLRLGADGDSAKKALVLRTSRQRVALAVDRMTGRHEVVVRPIDDPLGRAPGISGATDLGDGRPTLLLDLCELAEPSA